MGLPESPASLEAMGRLKAVFFDLDGTLINTDDGAVEAVASKVQRFWGLFSESNPRPFLRRAMLAAEGPVNRVVTLLDLVGLDDNVLSLGDRLRRLRGMAVRGEFVAAEGVIEMLRSLSGTYLLGIVTTRSRRDTADFLEQYQLEGLFRVIAAREDTRRLKPHPEPIHYAAAFLGISTAECVMVGDTSVDIVSAKAAGSFAIGVLSGFGEREDLLRAGADLIMDSTAQLAAWF